jgi:hypothetical protein
MRYMLRNILCRLRPGGLGYFQVPTYLVGYEFDADAYLESELKLGTPEMHVFPQAALVDTIERSGCRLLEMREDGAAGIQAISNRVLVQKR